MRINRSVRATLLTTLALCATAPAPIASADPAHAVWDSLAECESSGNWSINTGNGYYGGLQFSRSTWLHHGGGDYANYPHEATREEQIAIAISLRDASGGYGPWPSCSRQLGLPQ